MFSLITSPVLLALTVLHLSSVFAIPTAETSSMDMKYPLEPLTLSLPVYPTPNSPLVNVTGTIEDAIAAAVAMNPNWHSDFASIRDQILEDLNFASSISSPNQQEKNDGNEFKPQAAIQVESMDCRYGFAADYNVVSSQLWAIALTPGQPTLHFRRCGRISCSAEKGEPGVEVRWCNLTDQEDIGLDSYATIQIAASEVLYRCPVTWNPVKGIHGRTVVVGGWDVGISATTC
ncbi:hypothetical protein B0T20DRAFT_388238 [Sordaria brevicollis]|uniref:Ig-like domain-containing protein n=1 Tax=Sordaria brevicollis TaxID=83679 RepID=A0AAE0PMC3_SORBR|nr:hypothetical protein B0T20DRAFT_388238 [Sordaria brevicollis]